MASIAFMAEAASVSGCLEKREPMQDHVYFLLASSSSWYHPSVISSSLTVERAMERIMDRTALDQPTFSHHPLHSPQNRTIKKQDPEIHHLSWLSAHLN